MRKIAAGGLLAIGIFAIGVVYVFLKRFSAWTEETGGMPPIMYAKE